MVTPDRALRLRGTGVGGVTIPGVGTGVAPPTPVVPISVLIYADGCVIKKKKTSNKQWLIQSGEGSGEWLRCRGERSGEATSDWQRKKITTPDALMI
ncbi:hypothetical protein Tco_1567025 [Tanacetum coccineum]